jgi:hypothetical protein
VFDANGLQVGIVSFGYGGCASNEYQDVYVNIAAFSDWIDKYALGEDCQPFEGDLPDTTDTPVPTTLNPDTTDPDTGTEGEDVGEETEEPSDLDAFLDCFTTVYKLVQNLMGDGGIEGALDVLGGGDGAAGGDDDGGKGAAGDETDVGGGKGADEVDQDQDGGKGAGKGVVREFLDGVSNIFGDGGAER